MLIREAVFPDDAPIVRALFEEYAAGLGVDLCFQGFAAELDGLPGAYARPRGGVWLAEVDGSVAGCVALRPVDGQTAEVKRLSVRPAFRGARVGRALAEHVLRAARAKRYRRACLDTLPSMIEAIALYRSLGFVEIEPYYSNPVAGALFMELALEAAEPASPAFLDEI